MNCLSKSEECVTKLNVSFSSLPASVSTYCFHCHEMPAMAPFVNYPTRMRRGKVIGRVVAVVVVIVVVDTKNAKSGDVRT